MKRQGFSVVSLLLLIVESMKKEILFCLLIFFSSCIRNTSNDGFIEEAMDSLEVPKPSYEYLKSLGLWESEGMNIYTHLKNNYFVLPAGEMMYSDTILDIKNIDIKTYTGYTSVFPEQCDIHILFDSIAAEEIDLECGVYVCDYIRFDKAVVIDEGLRAIPIISEKCGFMPEGSGRRGYSGFFQNDTIKMYTYLYIIKRNLKGNVVINKTYPVFDLKNNLCDISWNIGIIKE